ncbi:MAG: hypothetical protein DRO67_00760 [Candidatus Asgardarchaeum californiense]|nr:MAG: hypothetical protein DRO67_00760 [Candidatus Asgardarchaeum californiense]
MVLFSVARYYKIDIHEAMNLADKKIDTIVEQKNEDQNL